jgi:hypothetical protein
MMSPVESALVFTCSRLPRTLVYAGGELMKVDGSDSVAVEVGCYPKTRPSSEDISAHVRTRSSAIYIIVPPPPKLPSPFTIP